MTIASRNETLNPLATARRLIPREFRLGHICCETGNALIDLYTDLAEFALEDFEALDAGFEPVEGGEGADFVPTVEGDFIDMGPCLNI